MQLGSIKLISSTFNSIIAITYKFFAAKHNYTILCYSEEKPKMEVISMREDAFREWMLQLGTMQLRPIGDAISRCKRVIKALDVDLDTEYCKDRCTSLLKKLAYTAEDAALHVPVDVSFGFSSGENLKNGMASLRVAVNKYVDFCNSVKL